jgi:hypothetical protein
MAHASLSSSDGTDPRMLASRMASTFRAPGDMSRSPITERTASRSSVRALTLSNSAARATASRTPVAVTSPVARSWNRAAVSSRR